MENFTQGIDEFSKYLAEMAEGDLKQILIPKYVVGQIRLLEEIRKTLSPEKMNDSLVPVLLTKQTELANAKYLIGRHLSLMKGAQSYAYIYRKFKTASEYNQTKERLQALRPARMTTVAEIDSELEKGLLIARKTEVAYQIAGDKLECLLEWCDKMIMIIQNRLRDENTDKRQTYAMNNAPK